MDVKYRKYKPKSTRPSPPGIRALARDQNAVNAERGGMGAVFCEGLVVFAWSMFAPHFVQNLSPGAFSAPQVAHVGKVGVVGTTSSGGGGASVDSGGGHCSCCEGDLGIGAVRVVALLGHCSTCWLKS